MEKITTTVDVLGQRYQIKCAAEESALLQQAGQYLEQNMLELRQTNPALNNERLTVIAALNITYQLLTIEQKHAEKLQCLEDKLQNLYNLLAAAIKPINIDD